MTFEQIRNLKYFHGLKITKKSKPLRLRSRFHKTKGGYLSLQIIPPWHSSSSCLARCWRLQTGFRVTSSSSDSEQSPFRVKSPVTLASDWSAVISSGLSLAARCCPWDWESKIPTFAKLPSMLRIIWDLRILRSWVLPLIIHFYILSRCQWLPHCWGWNDVMQTADILCNDVCFNSPESKRMSPFWFLTMIISDASLIGRDSAEQILICW